MKKIFNITFTILLVYFSFYYTNKVSNFIKDKDPIMFKIKSNLNKYYKEPINAIINDNTIIPGVSGLTINVNESYTKMKKVNTYLDNMLVFDSVKPTISLKDNLDKLVISGNKINNNVSILLKINDLDILKKLNNQDYNYLLSEDFINNNIDYLKTINNNIISINDNINLIDYCYTNNIKSKSVCNKPTIYSNPITYNYTYNTINNLDNGSILTYQVINDNSIKEINKVVSTIKNSGFNIVNLDTLLIE